MGFRVQGPLRLIQDWGTLIRGDILEEACAPQRQEPSLHKMTTEPKALFTTMHETLTDVYCQLIYLYKINIL